MALVYHYVGENHYNGLCCAEGCEAKLAHDVWIETGRRGKSLKMLVSLCDRHTAMLPLELSEERASEHAREGALAFVKRAKGA